MRHHTLAAATLLLSACAPQVGESLRPPAAAPAEFPQGYYEQEAARGHPVFRIDPAASLVVIKVYRGGSLARFGHDHVIASHEVHGYVAPGQGRADLYVALGTLAVDEPTLRSEMGFNTQPSESDIAGTRSNMHEKVLQTAVHPFALVRATSVSDGVYEIALTLHGTTRRFRTPAQFKAHADEVSAQGQVAVNQSDFGIIPFSILGGAIQVQDRVEVIFHVIARKEGDR